MVATLFYTQSELDEAVEKAYSDGWINGFLYLWGVAVDKDEEE